MWRGSHKESNWATSESWKKCQKVRGAFNTKPSLGGNGDWLLSAYLQSHCVSVLTFLKNVAAPQVSWANSEKRDPFKIWFYEQHKDRPCNFAHPYYSPTPPTHTHTLYSPFSLQHFYMVKCESVDRVVIVSHHLARRSCCLWLPGLLRLQQTSKTSFIKFAWPLGNSQYPLYEEVIVATIWYWYPDPSLLRTTSKISRWNLKNSNRYKHANKDSNFLYNLDGATHISLRVGCNYVM